MIRFGKSVACGLSLLSAAALVAQPPEGGKGKGGGRGFGGGRGGPGGMMALSSPYVILLENADVQKELALSADEKSGVPLLKDEMKKIDEAVQKEFESAAKDAGGGREAFRAIGEKMSAKRKDIQKLIAEGLGEEKAKRFMQIYYQMVGLTQLARMSEPEVSKKLGISDEQNEKIREMQREAFQASGIDFRSMFNQDASEEEKTANRKKMQDLQKSTEEKVLKDVFTDSQRKYVEELRGKPVEFRVSLTPNFGGRGPGGPGGAPGGGDQGGRRNRQGGKGGDRPAEKKA